LARTCDCHVCTGGIYGEYTALLHQAQADTDPARSQTVMSFLAIIGPYAGSTGPDGKCPGDALAAPMLKRLYDHDTDPDPQPTAKPPLHHRSSLPREAPPHRRRSQAVTGMVFHEKRTHMHMRVYLGRHMPADPAPANLSPPGNAQARFSGTLRLVFGRASYRR
jgi:hypothetical protein